MVSYEKFAPFYDQVLGNRADSAKEILSLLRKHHPRCKTVLEVACGKGVILKTLSKHYQVVGLDLSPSMLKIARKQLRGVKLHHDDMTSFNLNCKFDAIICVFDSINHLLKFAE